MSYLKTKGLIIKEVNIGEADKIVTIFSKARGKISALAKGARRPRSKLVAGSQFLCYCDYVLFSGKEMYSINTSEVIEPFYEIRNNLTRLTYAVHFIDIISDVIQENQPSGRVLQLLLNSLHMLAKTDREPELIARIFELRLLSIMGYAPFVKSCIICGKNDMDNVSFSFKKCGFICGEEKCISNDIYAFELSSGAVKAIRHIIHSRFEELFSFRLSANVLQELEKINKRYMRERLEKDYNKLDFLKNLN